MALTFSICIPFIPVHVQFLSECFESIYAQIHKSNKIILKEIILIGCESNPFTEKYALDQIQVFKKKLNILPQFFSEKKSVGWARNKALDQASGDIVVSMSAYDTMIPGKLEILDTIFQEKSNIIGVLHHFIENMPFPEWKKIQEQQGLPIQNTTFEKSLIISYFFDQQNIHFGHAAFRASVLKKFKYSETPKLQDINMIQQLLNAGYQENLVIYQAPLICYYSTRSLSYNNYSLHKYNQFLYDLYTTNKPAHIFSKSLSVSVCIPCVASHVQYLYQCILSIANQENASVEEVNIVISESTPSIKDDVKKLIDFFDQRHCLPVKAQFFEEKQFAGTNRNIALQMSSSDLIAFMDADDYMHPNKINLIRKTFRQYPFAAAFLHGFTENFFCNSSDNITSYVFDKNLIEPYHFDTKTEREIQFGHVTINRHLVEERYSDDPRGQDVRFIKNLLDKHGPERILIWTDAKLSVYMSERSSFYHIGQTRQQTGSLETPVSPIPKPVLSFDSSSPLGKHLRPIPSLTPPPSPNIVESDEESLEQVKRQRIT